MNRDCRDFFQSLNAHDVRYVIIGASAFPVHGYARATPDIGIFIEPTEINAEKVRDALSEFFFKFRIDILRKI